MGGQFMAPTSRSTLVDIIRDAAGYIETAKEVNAVPFSCCARKILETCMHHNVVQYGTKTISVGGCSFKVKHTAQLILWSEFGVYATCILIESIILFCLIRTPSKSTDEDSEHRWKKYLYGLNIAVTLNIVLLFVVVVKLESGGTACIRGDVNSDLNKAKVNK